MFSIRIFGGQCTPNFLKIKLLEIKRNTFQNINDSYQTSFKKTELLSEKIKRIQTYKTAKGPSSITHSLKTSEEQSLQKWDRGNEGGEMEK